MKIKPIKHWKSLSSDLIDVMRLGFLIFILGVLILPIFFEEDKAFLNARLSVLNNPKSPLTHLQLAEVAALRSDWQLARQEFVIADEFYSRNNVDSIALDLRFDEVKSIVFAERQLQEEIRQWKSVLEKQPSYRDGYLRLALLYYQLSEDEEAYDNWMIAWKLDPNNEQVARVGKLIRVEGF